MGNPAIGGDQSIGGSAALGRRICSDARNSG